MEHRSRRLGTHVVHRESEKVDWVLGKLVTVIKAEYANKKMTHKNVMQGTVTKLNGTQL